MTTTRLNMFANPTWLQTVGKGTRETILRSHNTHIEQSTRRNHAPWNKLLLHRNLLDAGQNVLDTRHHAAQSR